MHILQSLKSCGRFPIQRLVNWVAYYERDDLGCTDQSFTLNECMCPCFDLEWVHEAEAFLISYKPWASISYKRETEFTR